MKDKSFTRRFVRCTKSPDFGKVMVIKMLNRTQFLREQTISGANKCKRAPLPTDWSVRELPYSLPIRKALGLQMIFDEMPLFIGDEEIIVGTRTLYKPNAGNEDGHDYADYSISAGVPYVNEEDIKLFGGDYSYDNGTHYTPDYSIILHKGINGLLDDIKVREVNETLSDVQRDFLKSVTIVYTGLQNLIKRYSDYANELSLTAKETDRDRLLEIARICGKISSQKPDDFREAVQLLWFTHLGTMIESFMFINYGRLDVILGEYLKDMDRTEALQILECFLLKMYDQVDMKDDYLGKYAAQLVVTLGGVLPDGESAVNEVTMLFLDAIDHVRLPEPEFNLRIHSKNPSEYIDRAAKLTISGCNFISYYNDDLFIDSMNKAGIPIEIARDYGFDLCQDINIPGRSDFFDLGGVSLAQVLMELLLEKDKFDSFNDLLNEYKSRIKDLIKELVDQFNIAQEHHYQYRDEKFKDYFDAIKHNNAPVNFKGKNPMCPLPYLSALFHGTIENAIDMVYESYPIKEVGVTLGTSVEAINSLAAIKKVVYDRKQYSLQDVVQACKDNYNNESQKILRSILFLAPKWGNDDDYVDDIAKDILEYALKEILQYRTFNGGKVLAGIHQPHPVPTGSGLMATPEGRYSGTPVSVTLTPESGTMKNSPTAALKSASKIDYRLIQWNFCIMLNYSALVFKGNDGKENFKTLLASYFNNGGLQHQPNVCDVNALKDAQDHPELFKDLIVRLWGVSAHFVDLPKELQDEMIERFCKC